MTTTDELLENAAAYAAAFDKGDLPLPPAKKVAVLACMDARLNPYGILGLSEGDAHVIRNAGGVVTDDEIRSLSISQHLLGTEEIILIHHTGCGMLTFNDADFKARLLEKTGVEPEWAAEAFSDLDEDVRQIDRPHHSQPVHPQQVIGARLRLRRHRRQPARGRLGGRVLSAAPDLRVEHGVEDERQRRHAQGDEGITLARVGRVEHEAGQERGPEPQDQDAAPLAMAEAHQPVVEVVLVGHGHTGASSGTSDHREDGVQDGHAEDDDGDGERGQDPRPSWRGRAIWCRSIGINIRAKL